MAVLKNVTITDTDSFSLPVGNTSQRSASPTAGETRFNSIFKVVEYYNGSTWLYLPPLTTSGMRMRLDAAEPASYSGSGTSWNDISGNANNSTLYNSPSFSSTYGGGLTFNKNTTYVGLPTDLITSNDFTVMMWVKGDGTGNGQTIFANYPAGPLQLFYSTAYIGMYLNNSSAYASTTNYTADPVQFTAVRSGSDTYVYLNNVMIKQGSSDSSLGTSKPFRIGTNTSGTEPYGGTVYTCQVFPYALTSSQINDNYTVMRRRFGV